MDEKILVNKCDYEELKKDSHFLMCLESSGVDNWDWYSDAYREHMKKYPDPDYDEDDEDDG